MKYFCHIMLLMRNERAIFELTVTILGNTLNVYSIKTDLQPRVKKYHVSVFFPEKIKF